MRPSSRLRSPRPRWASATGKPSPDTARTEVEQESLGELKPRPSLEVPVRGGRGAAGEVGIAGVAGAAGVVVGPEPE